MTGEAPTTAAPLRIAYLSGSPRIATGDDADVVGPRAHILGLIDALRTAGHQVDEFVLGDHVGRRGGGSSENAPAGSARQVLVDVVRLASRLPVAWVARRRLRGPYDVAYERYALFQQLGRVFRRRGATWVIESNAVLSEEARHERSALVLQRVAARLERRSYRRADLIVCVSEPLRALLIEQAGVPSGKVAVIPNAVDLGRFHPGVAAAVPPPPGGGLVVGYVGFVIERQGIDDLIHAVHRLRMGGTAISALIVGDGPDRARFERLAADLGVAAAVRFCGQVPWTAVPAHIASCSVAYSGQRGVGGMPMYHSPLKIYEYLAMGKPVVATAHPDAERTLVRADAGWTFPPGDRDALVEVLRTLAVMAEDELADAGARALAHVREHHTWSHRAQQLVDEIRRRGLLRCR